MQVALHESAQRRHVALEPLAECEVVVALQGLRGGVDQAGREHVVLLEDRSPFAQGARGFDARGGQLREVGHVARVLAHVELLGAREGVGGLEAVAGGDGDRREVQVHLRQIGHVEVAEVNSVVTWLADLTRENNLPQKALVLHQFQVQSLRDVNEVDQTRSELAVLIHVDGLGAQPVKQETWRTLLDNAPTIQYWGWKNFYDEDIPGPLTPAETMTKVDPVPDFVSYQ